jgi:small subunit ribosomal protein S6e
MKISIASPTTGTQKTIEIDDERKLLHLYEKRISQEIDAGVLGDQYKGYIFRITGGSDKQGFPMKQGVLSNSRVSLLLSPGTIGFAEFRARGGERRRKTIRGCIVASDISSLNVAIVKNGEQPIEGLTDIQAPRRLGPKRASKIRKLFNLTSEDDVTKFVVRRPIPAREATDAKKAKSARAKSPKIQRLVTSVTRQRKRRKKAALKARWSTAKTERDAYQKTLSHMVKVAKQRQKARAERKATAAAKPPHPRSM